MAPVRSKKRTSDQISASPQKAGVMNGQLVPLRSGSPSTPQRSPIRKRRGAITMQQKQAMIDNLQLEITDRARRLRAHYNMIASTIATRVGIRVGRIPTSLRKMKMGDLIQKYAEQEERRNMRPAATTRAPASRASPLKQTRPPQTTHTTGRAKKRMSDAISGDKENEFENNENAKKRVRGAPNTDHVRPTQVLSPTSSNSRLTNRPASPIKSGIARPASPLKNPSAVRQVTASSMFSSMVEKAKATRAGAGRKVTTTSTTSSSTASTTAGTRGRKAAPSTASRAPAARPATRNARRVSDNSETSEASTGTVVKKSTAAKTATTKRGVMGTIRKGVTGGAAKATTKAAAPATTGTGRVLRKRG